MSAAFADSRRSRASAGRSKFGRRLVVMSGVWWALNGLDAQSWMVGGPATVVAAWISLKLAASDDWRISWSALPAFVGFFLRESVRGGWEVARQALKPRLAVAPAVLVVPLKIPAGPGRVFLCGVVSLLPGTTVLELRESEILIHALDESPRIEDEIRELERRVAALFGVDVAPRVEALP